MKNFNKPNYIDEKFITATDNGWIDNRTGEILVAVPRLIERLTEVGYQFDDTPKEKITEETNEELVEKTVVIEETDTEIEKLVNEEIPVTTEEKPKRRGRPAKPKAE